MDERKQLVSRDEALKWRFDQFFVRTKVVQDFRCGGIRYLPFRSDSWSRVGASSDTKRISCYADCVKAGPWFRGGETCCGIVREEMLEDPAIWAAKAEL
jgi:hypothetical protein